ncbi:MAG: hypothetical protein AUG44_12510 [Actinobacteria bacterium 13_1_20CM_3_71_11]|nr:MAG: hypothetical protein AUG44_12510 [Actinobacteria bacterium 13_1_20CM_3_71_11]
MGRPADRFVGALLAHGLPIAHELFDACTVDVNPGSPLTIGLLFGRPPVRNGLLPDNWWTWVVQYLIPSGGPAVTSSAAAWEGLLVVGVAMIAGLLENCRTAVRHGRLLLTSVLPVPAGGTLASRAFVVHRQGGTYEQVPRDDRGGCPRPGRLRPAHAL